MALQDPGKPVSGRSKYQRLLFDAERFFKEKDFQTAFKIYQQALKDAPPGDHKALSQLCRCYRKKARKALKKEDHQTVFNLLQEMMNLEHVHPFLKARDYEVLANSCLEIGQTDIALKALQRAIHIAPEISVELQSLQRRLKTELLHQEMNGLH